MPTERHRYQFLEGVPLLRRLSPPALWTLAYEGENTTYDRNQLIQHPDIAPNLGSVYVLREGSALVISMEPLVGSWTDDEGMTHTADGQRVAIDPITGGRVVARLEPGDVFGATSLVDEEQRRGIVRAGSSGADVVAFDARAFHVPIAEQVLSFSALARECTGPDADMRRLGLFNDMPMRDLVQVMDGARHDSYRPGDAIITQGDEGDRFHLLLAGRAIVERDGDVIATLAGGARIGELALLMSTPRDATVRATTPTTCWSISRHAFELVMRHRLQPAAPAPVRDMRAGYAPGGALGSSLAARLRAAGS